MQPLKGDYAILGLGVTGSAVARFLLERVARGDAVSITLYDERDTEVQRTTAEELRARGVRVELGARELDADFDVCVASPGIPPHSALVRSAHERASVLLAEVELAYLRSVSPWLAVTGTNGKTTVTSMCAHLLRYAGVPTECVGNIGEPAISIAEEAGISSVIVAEVSSFQLALTRDFHPRVAVLLNITPDHIDWHGSLEAYAADKARVFANMGPGDTAIIDMDDPGSAAYAAAVAAGGCVVVPVSRLGVPDGGAGLEDGWLILDEHGVRNRLVHTDDLRIRGAHNVANALAAAAAVHALGVPAASIAESIVAFEPIAHRLEPVGVIDGVEYVNDSKATNPGATRMALTAFPDRPVVLLLGGRNKGNDFSEIADSVSGCRAIIAFGEAAGQIAKALDAVDVPVTRLVGMLDAWKLAARLAEPGDVVLLSPACASFDEFSGYAERGRVFANAVRELEEAKR